MPICIYISLGQCPLSLWLLLKHGKRYVRIRSIGLWVDCWMPLFRQILGWSSTCSTRKRDPSKKRTAAWINVLFALGPISVSFILFTVWRSPKRPASPPAGLCGIIFISIRPRILCFSGFCIWWSSCMFTYYSIVDRWVRAFTRRTPWWLAACPHSYILYYYVLLLITTDHAINY